MESLVIDPNFWADKKVFLTGHTGFKGSWLCHILDLLGAKVSGYSLEPELNTNLFQLSKVEANLNHHTIGNILNIHKMETAIKECQPDFVIHFAAQPLVVRSYHESHSTFETNVMGTVNLLEILRRRSIKAPILVATTDKVYLNSEEGTPFVESDPLGGGDPYSASKASAEHAVFSYAKSFMSKQQQYVVAARSGNVIGGGDFSENRIIPDIIRTIKAKETLQVRSPTSVRPWQHVLEPICAYLLLLQHTSTQQASLYDAWNIGPELEDCVPVDYICQSAQRSFHKHFKYEKLNPNEKTLAEHQLLRLDCTKIKQKLGWAPQFQVNQALSLTWEWYKAYLAGEDIAKLTRHQAKNYLLNMNCKI